MELHSGPEVLCFSASPLFIPDTRGFDFYMKEKKNIIKEEFGPEKKHYNLKKKEI